MVTSDQGHNGRPRGGRGRFTRSSSTAKRDAEACRLRALGLTYEQIAAQLGYRHRSLSRRAVERALAATVREPADELRMLELARLDRLWQEAWAVMKRQHVTVSNGRVVRLGDQPVQDDGPVLAAIDRLLKIQERRARLLGLDAQPTREAVTVDEVDAEIRRLSEMLGISDGTGWLGH